MAGFTPELTGKQVQLLKETVPKMSRMGVLWHMDNPSLQRAFGETQAAAQRLGLQLLDVGVRSADELEAAFETASRGHARFAQCSDLGFQGSKTLAKSCR